MREETLTVLLITNVIAAYTTAQVRLKLYKYLELLDRRVLYYDTDRCIYASTGEANEYEPCTGNFLGDMTNSRVTVISNRLFLAIRYFTLTSFARLKAVHTKSVK